METDRGIEDSRFFVGVDVGTTAVKSILFDQRGSAVHSLTQQYPKYFPDDGRVEQDPQHWISAILEAINEFSERVDLSAIEAMCICSQVNTHVFVGRNGAPLIPAIVWSDTRAKSKAAQLDAQYSARQKNDIWGFEFVLDASFSLSRAAWLAEHHSQLWSETDWIMSPKDYCNFVFSGVAASDAPSSVGLVNGNGDYIDAFDAVLPGFSTRLPPLSGVTECIGETGIEQFPDLKAKLFTGTLDASANFVGSGVVDKGLAALIGGTSSIVGVMSSNAKPANGIITFPPEDGRYLHAGPTQSGADAFTWFAGSLGTTVPKLMEKVPERSVSTDSPIFLPYLQGERAPLWDPDARGTFIGLAHNHDAIDMALAVAEGVAYSERHVFEVCSQAAGFDAPEIRLSGGSSKSNYWSQLRANCLGVKMRRLRETNTGALGASMMAMVGSGVYEDMQGAARCAVSFDATFTPDPDRQSMFDKRYALYRDSYTQLTSIFTRMADANAGH